MSTSVWKTVRVPDNDWISHRIGPLSLYLKRVLNEIWVADSRDDNSYGEPSALPEEPEWTRTALPEEYDEFDISPVLPDRPVVVDSDQAYRITPNTGVRTYCRIPAFARITPKHLPELIIAEIPTVILSGTWFGVFTEGELSYALYSTLQRNVPPELFEPHLIWCPMEIRNSSDHELKFEKLSLRVERLSVYMTEDAMWSDESLIIYHGKEINSDVEMKGKLPPEAKGGRLVGSPRLPAKSSMAIRTFKLLRDLNLPWF